MSRSRKVLIAAVVVLLVGAAAVGAWSWWGPDGSAPGPDRAAPSTSPPPAVTAAPGQGAADGCLGGPDPQAAILAAQRQAPLTTVGAAEFVMTFQRWSGFLPRGDAAADQKVLSRVVAGPLRKAYGSGPVAWAPPGQEGRWWTDSTQAYYRVVSQASDRVVLDVWVRQYAELVGQEPVANVTGDRLEVRAVKGRWVMWASPEAPAGQNDWETVLRNEFRGTVKYTGGC